MTVSESSSIFMDELRALTQLVENPSQEGDEFTALQLNGLEKVEEEHGRQSEVYRTAALSMQAILSHVCTLNTCRLCPTSLDAVFLND